MNLRDELMKISYNPEVSLGNILQVIAIFGSVAAAYGSLTQADTKHDLELAQHTREIVEIKQRQETVTKEVREEIKDIKKGVDGINEKLVGVLIDNARQSNQRRVQ